MRLDEVLLNMAPCSECGHPMSAHAPAGCCARVRENREGGFCPCLLQGPLEGFSVRIAAKHSGPPAPFTPPPTQEPPEAA